MITNKPSLELYEQNIYAPRADKLALYIPFNDGTGTELEAIGSLLESGGIFNPIIVPQGTWDTTDEGGSVFLDSNNPGDENQHVLVADNVDGSDIEYERGTMLLRFSVQGNFGTDNILSTGSASSEYTGGLLIQINDDTIYVQHRIGNISTMPEWTFSYTKNVVYNLILSWGERGFHAWLDGTAGTAVNDPQEDTSAVVLISSMEMRLTGGGPFTHIQATMYAFGWWHWQLIENECNELFADPYNPVRYLPDTYFQTPVNPIVGRVTQTSATFQVTTAEDMTDSGTGSEAVFRIAYDTDPTLPDTTVLYSDELIYTSNDEDSPMEIVVDGLTASTRYYWIAQFQESPGGSDENWVNFPGGRGKFTTQRTSGSFSFAVISDDHSGSMFDYLDIADIFFGEDIMNYVSNIQRQTSLFHYWRTMQGIYEDDFDFTVNLGDTWYTDALDYRHKMQMWRRFWNQLFKSGSFFCALGNHEGENGYRQYDGCQLEATRIRKKFVCLPIGGRYSSDNEDGSRATYPEGGEYEQQDGDYYPDAGNDWIPALDSTPDDILCDQDYRDTYIIDSEGHNKSPLHNYYAFTWSNCLFVFLDAYRYTTPGYNRAPDDAPYFTLGNTQKAWLESTLRNSDATWKVLFIHQFLGGNGYYGRGSGVQVSSTRDDDFPSTAYDDDISFLSTGIIEETWIHNLMRQYNVTAYFKGHEHLGAHVIKESVNYINIPACGTMVFGVVDTNLFGNRATQGADLIGLGMQEYHRMRGYVKCIVTDSSFTVDFRETTIQKGTAFDNSSVDSAGNGSWSKYFGKEISVSEGTASVTLPDTPHNVIGVVNADDADWYNNPDGTGLPVNENWQDTGTNLYSYMHEGYGYQEWDQPFRDGNIEFLPSDGDIRVLYVPRTRYIASLSNAYLSSDISRNIEPHIVFSSRSITSSAPAEEVARFQSNQTHIGFVSTISGHVVTRWQVRMEHEPCASINLTTNLSGIVGRNIAIVTLSSLTSIDIQLDRMYNYYIRVNQNDLFWSSWIYLDLTGEKRTIVGKYRRDTVMTPSSRGATVTTNNPQWSYTSVSRGAIITPITYTRQRSRRKSRTRRDS